MEGESRRSQSSRAPFGAPAPPPGQIVGAPGLDPSAYLPPQELIDSARTTGLDRARADLWAQFANPGFWQLDVMVLVWALFMVIVFVIEPVAHARLAAEAARDPRPSCGVAGAHGGLFS